MKKILNLFPVGSDNSPFPGKWLGGVSLAVAPLLILLGILLRYQFDFFFPAQLEAMEQNHGLMFAAYSSFLAGIILLWPGIVLVAQKIGQQRPGLALWGGALVMLGLFARVFHAGIDHLAFQLVEIQGSAAAIEIIKASYGSYHIVSFLNAAILLGWIVLAWGAWRSRVLPLWGAIALALMAALPLGVLKGTTVASIVAGLGLVIALVPLGIRTLKDGQRPSAMAALRWIILLLVIGFLFYFLGVAG